MKTLIENLEDYQRAGLDLQSQTVDQSRTETQTGVITVLTRNRKYNYVLTLQDLTTEQIKETMIALKTKEDTRPYSRITIPTNLFTGYVGSGANDVDFNFDSVEGVPGEDEGVWSFEIKVTEIEVL